MLVDSRRPLWGLLQELCIPLLPIIAYLTAISWLDLRYHLEEFNFPPAIVTLLGTVIGLVLAFRTNSSYARWWEARTLWGAIVNDSRTWTRQLIAFSSEQDEAESVAAIIRRMSLRQAAWCFALSRCLRDQNPMTDLIQLVEADEIESYRGSQNVPNEMLLRQARDLRALSKSNNVELYQFVELERTLVRLTNSMGGCERIKNTPFPESYSLVLHGMIYAFASFLPFGLLNVPAFGIVLTALTLSFGFLMIERVAIYLQDPFSNRPSDTPMLAVSRTIEINIRQMLGDTDLPSKIEPINGVLY